MNPSDFLPVSRPMLPDVKSCEEWLARAALADSRQACATFVELLDEIEDAPPRGSAYLEILERLRRPMRATLEEQTRRFAAKPLPLSPAEDTAFVQACDLWLALLRAWQRLQRAADKRAELAQARPLLALRAIESAAGLIGAHFAARREIEPELWRWLHQSYAHAERHHLAETEIAAGGNEARSCAAAYAEVLLVHMAHPGGLGQRELAWTLAWARRWAPKVKLWRSAENGGGLAVDLEGAAGPAWTPAGVPGAALRFLDCSEVARSIRRRQKKLELGADPAELGLGRDCARPAVDELLAVLARLWSDAQQVHQFPRRTSASRAELAAGMAEIFNAIGGAPFEGTDGPWAYSRRSAEQIHIFQRAIENEMVRRQGTQLEHWETVDESANGFQLLRRTAGMRVANRQLVALRPSGARKFILCEVRWARQGKDLALAIGVKALPGLPQPCVLRTAAGQETRTMPAFVMPLAAGLAPTLVAPSGTYQNRREFELQLDGRPMKIVLSGLLLRGYDFDWVDFSVVGR
jgi:hypothetical protein